MWIKPREFPSTAIYFAFSATPKNKTFDLFGTLCQDVGRIFARIKVESALLVAENEVFRNARENSSGAARIIHDEALAKVMLNLLKDDAQFYRLFVENDAFRRAVSDFVYSLTAA